MTDIAVKLDADHLWGSGSNQGWFDLLSVRWLLVDGSVPGQNSFFALSLIPHIRSWASREALFLCFSPGTIALILLKAFPQGTWDRMLVIVLVYHESLSVFYKSISSLITWCVPPVISKPCKHNCWTRLLALFQTKCTRLFHFELVACSNGFLHFLVIDLSLRIGSPLFILRLL